MAQTRVVHFVNHFFAGIGGEEKADIVTEARDAPVGPGRALAKLLPSGAGIVGTVYCGDNYFNENIEAARRQLLEHVTRLRPQLFVAGPAFGAGRYGIACVEACRTVATELAIPCLTAMHQENPGVDVYRSNKDLGMKVFVLPTQETA
ncbi:MAG: glycine/betaine/sarcosine/D-proline family reductase selenoprotein B, partial [Chloroflexi bacterium]|nr:glycine/betaine/sarcosine/D-proline family reductase selenoprotein B [Chloroflexota bacterium]